MGFFCAHCGREHDGLPDIGADRPAHYWNVPEAEREKRIFLTEDICVVDEEHFYVRGVIEIPVHDFHERFGFGVWVSHKKENYQAYLENFDSDEIGPFFGWLCTEINYFEQSTMLLKTMAHYRGQGLRPAIELEPTEHPLAVAQREGIAMEEALAIVHHYDR